VEHEVPPPVLAVGHEGRAGRARRVHPDLSAVHPSARRRSRITRPNPSAPTAPTMAAGAPQRATWSMKIAGAPLGKGPR
jgi:hypothetical protein